MVDRNRRALSNRSCLNPGINLTITGSGYRLAVATERQVPRLGAWQP